MKLLFNSLALFAIVSLRYFIFAGSAYFLCWVWKREAWWYRRIQKTFPEREALYAEIKWSLLSSAVFAVSGAVLFAAWEKGYTLLYSDVGKYGWPYLVVSLPTPDVSS